MKKRRVIWAILFSLVISLCFIEDFAKTQQPAAEIKFREMRFRKPPLVDLYFNVVLRNGREEPRWFLLPSNLGAGAESIATKGGIDGVEVFVPQGKGRVVLGHFLGTGGFHALYMPARAEVRLRLFPISFWGDLPDDLQVQVIIAKRLTVGGEEAKAWFAVDPLSSVKADIAESPINHIRMLSARRTPNNKEVPISIEEDSRLRLQVSLKANR